VARYGIDIWMTTNAITQSFRIAQSNLGAKIHDAKDPGQHLGPMFRQVLWTIFSLMERHESYWKGIRGSEAVELFGYQGYVEPEPVNVDAEAMIEHFKIGYQQFSSLWREIFCKGCFEEISRCAEKDVKSFDLPTDAWVQILYELAATFHQWKVNRNKLIDLVTPLYYARVASFIRQSWEMSSAEAEDLVEEQAMKFEDHKEYLVRVWEKKSAQAAKT
jgi:glucosylglycerate synthase